MTPNAYQLHCPKCNLTRQARFDEPIPETCRKCGTPITHTNIQTPRDLGKVTPYDAWRVQAQMVDRAMALHLKSFADDARAYVESCIEYELRLAERFPMPPQHRNSRTIPATFPAWKSRGNSRQFPLDRRWEGRGK